MNIRQAIDSSPMSGYQWYLVALTTILNALDGYDVLAMAFTANAVSEEFGLTGGQLGTLLSAGLIGMAVGSLVLGPLADKFGRRRILLLSLLVNIAGLGMSATADSAASLGFWRVVTGLGIGGILATVTVVTSEYSNNRNRGMAISIFTAGYGLGATLGGLLAAELIPAFGWRTVYVAGAAMALAVLVLCFFTLPESIDYLRVKRPPRAQEKIDAIAGRIGKPGHYPLGDVIGADERPIRMTELLGGEFRSATLKLWIAFFLIMFGFYFANSWTPKLLVESGMTENQGIIGGLMLTLGGAFGSIIYGLLTVKFNTRRTLMAFVAASAVMLVVFIYSTSVPAIAFASGVVVGMLINGCIAGLYTVTPAAYPPALRTTGVGGGIGVGRLGAILAPITVGALLDQGWSPAALYTAVAVVVVFAALALIGIRPYLGAGSAAGSTKEPKPAQSGQLAEKTVV